MRRILIWEKFKAWRRGERMIPGATKGRCFVKKNPPEVPASGVKKTKSKATMKLVGIRVIRANGDIEDIKHG